MRSLLGTGVLSAVAFVVAGCGSSGDADVPRDGGADVADARVDVGFDASPAADTASDGAPLYPACGDGPYFTYELTTGEIDSSGAFAHLSTVVLTFDECPGMTFMPDSLGIARASLSKGKPFTAKVRAENHIGVDAAERMVPLDDDLAHFRDSLFVPLLSAGAIPAYADGTPSFALFLDGDGTSGVCGDVQHVYFTTPTGVAAHFMLPTWPKEIGEPIAPDGSSGPVVFFTGVTAGNVGGIVPSKIGCTVVSNGKPTYQTGKFTFEPGVWTVGNLALRP